MNPPQRTRLDAAYVAPMDVADRRVIADASIVIEHERIAWIGPTAALPPSHAAAARIDLRDCILLPGLVNAHAHLELSDCPCGDPPSGGFAGWLAGMLRRTRLSEQEMEQRVGAAVPLGVSQCLRFGVCTVGDISRQCTLTRSILRDMPLRVTSYGEVQAMAQRRSLLEDRLAIAADQAQAGPRLRIGITPHAPYSVEPGGYQRCLAVARAHAMPLATHLAESPDESAFLAEHRGPLRELWDAWLTWDAAVPTFVGGPIRFARSLGLLDYPTLLAHVNYCDDDELAILASGNASVVYCPRTHAYFGHPPHRWRDMLARGINVAVGTDSCASSPDLNLVDDLRRLHRIAPDVSAVDLWSMATTRAAAALGLSASIGSITVGKFADLVAFAVPAAGTAADPLLALLECATLPAGVWIGGVRR